MKTQSMIPRVNGSRGAAALLLALGGMACTSKSGEEMKVVTSKDGTRIAHERAGKGPAVIIVNGALATRSGGAELAQLMASHFTVYTYDRRGRGDSADAKTYAVEREIEDLQALIDEAGGSAHVFGGSSGASLAIEAAARLGNKVQRLALYEAPYDEAEGAAETWTKFRVDLGELLAADRRGDAVALFLKVAGVPDQMLAGMKTSPAWAGMEAMAPTIAYDTAVVGQDRAIPVDRAGKIQATTLVMDGGASQKTLPFMRVTADKLAKVIPNAQRRTLEGQGHNASAKVMAPVLIEFFSGRN